MIIIDNRDRDLRANPKNIGKCTFCHRHLIQEEVLGHFAKYHNAEWLRVLKKLHEEREKEKQIK